MQPDCKARIFCGFTQPKYFSLTLAMQRVCVKGWHSPCSAFSLPGSTGHQAPQPPTVSSSSLCLRERASLRDAWEDLGTTGSRYIIIYHFTRLSTQSPLPCRQAGKCTTASILEDVRRRWVLVSLMILT